MLRSAAPLLLIPFLVQCGKDSDSDQASLVTGSCTATVTKQIFDTTQTFKNCMDFKDAKASTATDCSTDGAIFLQAGTWSSSSCEPASTASCTLNADQTYLGVVYGYDANYNAYLKGSCDKNKGTFAEITASTKYTATVRFASVAHDSDTCMDITGLSAPYRDAMKAYYEAKKDAGTWTWTNDDTCPTADVKATCDEVNDFYHGVTAYYFAPNDSYKTDCESRGQFKTL